MLKILVVILSIAGLWSFNASAQENEFVSADEVIEVAGNPEDLAAEVNADIEAKRAEIEEAAQAKVDEITESADEKVAEVSESVEEVTAEHGEDAVEKLGEAMNINESANEKIDNIVAAVKAKDTAKEMSGYIRKLNLSPEQIEKVKELNEISSQKQRQLLDSVSWLRDQAHQLEKLTIDAFRDILTDEQKIVFEELRAADLGDN